MDTAQRERGSIFGLDDLGFESWQRREIFLFFQISQTSTGAYLFSCSVGTGVLSQEWGQGVLLTTDLHPMPGVGMAKAVPLCLQYVPSWFGQGQVYVAH